MRKGRSDRPAPSPRRSNITVVVRYSEEEIDFDAWADRYLRAVIEIDRAKQAAKANADVAPTMADAEGGGE